MDFRRRCPAQCTGECGYASPYELLGCGVRRRYPLSIGLSPAANPAPAAGRANRTGYGRSWSNARRPAAPCSSSSFPSPDTARATPRRIRSRPIRPSGPSGQTSGNSPNPIQEKKREGTSNRKLVTWPSLDRNGCRVKDKILRLKSAVRQVCQYQNDADGHPTTRRPPRERQTRHTGMVP